MQQTITNLKDLPNAMREKADKVIYKVALWAFRYQDFKTRIAIQHKPEGYSESTLMNYFEYGVSYIKYGKRIGNYAKFYSFLDEIIKKHTQPYNPSEQDRRQFKKQDYTKKDNIPPVAKLNIVNKPLIAKVQYALQMDDLIRVCPSEDYAKGYLDCLKRNSKTEAKIITVEIGEP